jgi:selenocysteine-specific elongation factor
MIIGTAGHIDHGKTTLVRALTGVDTDRLPEEKRRGITIELGFAPLELDGLGTVGVVDVPGHEAFVRTMVAGASGIDVALLVVAADEGVMPQTVEHLSILDLLGTRAGVIALTKCDLVDEDWLLLVTADVRDAVHGTPLEDARIVRTSAATGTGIDTLRAALSAAIQSIPVREAVEAFRMPVDRAFSVRGTGTVVTGTVWEGSASVGGTLVVQPAAKTVRVRAVQSHGVDVTGAQAGTRAALALAGVDVADVERGAWLCGDPDWPVTNLIRAEVTLLADANHALRPREWVRLHVGTSDVGARVVVRGGALQPGALAAARVILQEPVLLRAGDRFVLRIASPASTIGGGVVVDPLPPRRRFAPWNRLERAEDTLGRMLMEAGGEGVELAVVPVRSGVPRATLQALLRRPDVALSIGTRCYHPQALTDACDAIERLVHEGHQRDPLGDGLAVAGVTASLRVSGELAERAITGLCAVGRIERRGAFLTAPDWRPILGASDADYRDRLLADIRAGGAEPPDVATLAERYQRDPIPILRLLEREHLVIPVEPGRFYAAEAVDRLVTRLRDGMTEDREYNPSELREVLGLSRKYLIPFLEFCDRKRVTERRATGRVRVAPTA